MNTKVRLQTSRLLNERFNLSPDGLQEKYISLKSVWELQQELILDGLEKVTGLTFLKNYIDVFLINPDDKPSISFPIIVKLFNDEAKTIRIIIHELIHNLMWDNEQGDHWSKKVCEQYNQEDPKVARHIAVHAILEALYVDILKNPQEIERDIVDCASRSTYARAWEIVYKKGYKEVIKDLQK